MSENECLCVLQAKSLVSKLAVSCSQILMNELGNEITFLVDHTFRSRKQLWQTALIHRSSIRPQTLHQPASTAAKLSKVPTTATCRMNQWALNEMSFHRLHHLRQQRPRTRDIRRARPPSDRLETQLISHREDARLMRTYSVRSFFSSDR